MSCTILDSNNELLSASISSNNNLYLFSITRNLEYTLNTTIVDSSQLSNTSNTSNTRTSISNHDLQYRRLGHISSNVLSKLEESYLNFPKLDKPASSNTTYKNYIISKVTTKVNQAASKKRTIYLNLVSSDLFGPI